MHPIEDTLEAHLLHHSASGSPIYLALVGLVLLLLGMLPVIRVQVSIQGTGMIRPLIETHDVQAQAGGVVEAIQVRQHQIVTAGAEMLRLVDEPLLLELTAVEKTLDELQQAMSDLGLLSVSASNPAPPLRTTDLLAEHARYMSEIRAVALRIEQAQVELGRIDRLTALGVAAPVELEDQIQRVSQLETELISVESGYRIEWRRRLQAMRERVREMEARREELKQRIAGLIVRAPIDGSIEELIPLSPGSFVQAGRAIASISPATPLRAEVLVPPKDIGLLSVGLPARLAIDAFNHHDWGFLMGSIAEISQDVALVDGRPRYRVGVIIDGDHLELPTGARGQVRKGMTLQARFMVTERTLLQLLRDDLDGWLNPLTNPA